MKAASVIRLNCYCVLRAARLREVDRWGSAAMSCSSCSNSSVAMVLTIHADGYCSTLLYILFNPGNQLLRLFDVLRSIVAEGFKISQGIPGIL